MNTMHPVIVFGSYRWDQDLLPLDEFEERLRELRRVMKREGWAGLIVHGDAQESAMLTWLTNFYPRLRWAVAMIGLEGEPELLVGGATRDLPAAKMLTWCTTFQSFGDAPRLLAGWMERVGAPGPDAARAPIAVHGLERMRESVRSKVIGAVGSARAIDATPTLDLLLRQKRWRELRVIREAHGILASTIGALKSTWEAGAPVKTAVLAAERHARLAQSQDVRILFSLDGGETLQPFEDMSEERQDTLVCIVAIRYLGYWAQAYVTHGKQQSPVRAATARVLEALRDAAVPGASGSAFADAARPHVAGFALHPMLEGSFGHGTGLDLAEPPFFTPGSSDDAMREGGVYALHAGLVAPDGTAALLSHTLCIVDGRAETLSSQIQKVT